MTYAELPPTPSAAPSGSTTSSTSTNASASPVESSIQRLGTSSLHDSPQRAGIVNNEYTGEELKIESSLIQTRLRHAPAFSSALPPLVFALYSLWRSKSPSLSSLAHTPLLGNSSGILSPTRALILIVHQEWI